MRLGKDVFIPMYGLNGSLEAKRQARGGERTDDQPHSVGDGDHAVKAASSSFHN